MGHIGDILRAKADEYTALAQGLRSLADMESNGLRYREPFDVCDDCWPEEVELPNAVQKPIFEVPDAREPIIFPKLKKPNTDAQRILTYIQSKYPEFVTHSEVNSEFKGVKAWTISSALFGLYYNGYVERTWYGRHYSVRAVTDKEYAGT